MSGTFALMQTAAKANEFRGDADTDEGAGGTLHDDYCPAAPNKDVYVENWGEKRLYVRVRLDEYMETGKGAGLYLGTSLARTQNPLNEAASLMNDGSNVYTMSTWKTHVPSTSVDTCATTADFHKYWKWIMGGSKWYMPADPSLRAGSGYVDTNNMAYTGTSAGAKQTLTAKVVTMAQWKQMGEPIGSYWVIDADGWCYWAAPLEPKTATGLLLDAVNLLQKPKASYYYAINVIAQYATVEGEDNYLKFGDGSDGDHTWTRDGENLLDKLVNGNDNTVYDIAITSSNGTLIGDNLYLPQGAWTDLQATVNNAGNGSTAVTWAYNGSTGYTFTGSGNNARLSSQDGIPIGSKLTISAASVADASKNRTLQVIAIDKNAVGVVEGGDGNLYMDYGDNTFQRIDADGNPVGNMICGGMDQKPGTADDRTDIVFTKDGTKLLGPNNDGSYQSKGPDGKLGTADDLFWWKKAGNENADVKDLTFTGDETGDFTQTAPNGGNYVRNIVISPSTGEVRKGNTLQMSAVVYKGNNTTDSGGVTWSVMPANSASITENGLLTISSSATADTVTVIATSKTDSTKTATVNIKVAQDITETPEAVDGRILTPDLTGDTSNWVEIATNGGYSLIVRANYLNIYSNGHNGDPTWQYTNFGSTADYKTSILRTKINNWFNGAAAGTADNLPANARLRQFTMQNNAANTPGTASVTAGITNGFSKPATIKIPSGSDDVAFALSYGEASNFCSNIYFLRGPVANNESSGIAKANYGKINIPNIVYYHAWLRSTGDITDTMGSLSGPYGSLPGRAFQEYVSKPSAYGLVYPALWVDSGIFAAN